MRHFLLQNEAAFLLQKEFYYKVRQVLQREANLSKSATDITKYGDYYQVRRNNACQDIN